EVREQPTDLAVEHADELRPARHRNRDEALRREAERVLLIHRRDVIEPVEITDRLEIGLMLDQLLGAAMQQADVRIDALDDFSVELEDKPQHPMGRRVLRSKIYREVTEALFGHWFQLGFA